MTNAGRTAWAAVLERISRTGIIAVIRAGSPEEAARLAAAIQAGGIDVIEITFTVPRAAAVISDLKAANPGGETLVGAGTVLNVAQARRALDAGADFVVSPALDVKVVRFCRKAGALMIPGCMTVTEIVTARQAGAEAVKLFPASLLGPGFIRAVRTPLPGVRLVPTGGVSLSNVRDWIRAGSLAVGVGGELTGAGGSPGVTRAAEAFLAEVRAGRSLERLGGRE